MSQAIMDRSLTIQLENIGGIERTDVDLPPGLTVLSGRNATNRTSFLQGVMAAMGSESDQISLKSDADEGRAVIQMGNEIHARTLKRSGETVTMDGEPFTDDPELIDLYAFLLRENPVRRVVQQEGDLHSVLMRPIDTDEIEYELDRLQENKRSVEDEIERIEEQKARLPELEDRKATLDEELEELRAKETDLQSKKEELEETYDDSISDGKSERIGNLEDDLTAQRTDLSDIERQLEKQRRIREAAIEDIEEINQPDTERDELLSDRNRLRSEQNRLSDRIENLKNKRQKITAGMEAARTLQDSVTSIDEMISQLDVEISFPDGPLTDDVSTTGSDSVTSELVNESSFNCLACGSETTPATLDAVIDQYRAINSAFRERIRTLESENEDMRNEIRQVESKLDEWEKAQNQLDEAKMQKKRADTKIDELEASLTEAQNQVSDLEDQLKRVREQKVTTDTELEDEISSLEDKIIDLEVEIRQTKSRLDSVEADIQSVHAEIEAEDDICDTHDELVEKIQELKSRVDDTERELVEEFNETMSIVLELLEYGNIERIWIDRKREKVRVGRRTEEQSVFELNIVREGSDGVYSDELQHLSESERSVTGLVVALTGYIVHDVDDVCPVMLLDSVEMIDSERLGHLINYFRKRTSHFVATLLSEDAKAVADAVPESTVMELEVS